MRKILSAISSILLLNGCVATELSTQNKAYDASKEARVRLYGQNGKQSTMEVSINGKKEKITVGGGFGQAFTSMVGVKGNESIDMPETDLSKDPSAHSKALSGVFFKEFIVPAGESVTVNNGVSDLTNRLEDRNAVLGYEIIITTVKGCSGNSVSFVPEAGKDYEVAPVSSTADCGVTAYEIK